MKHKALFGLLTGVISLSALASCTKAKKDNLTSTSDMPTTKDVVETEEENSGTANPVETMVVDTKDKKVTEEVFNSFFGSYNDSLNKLNIELDYSETSGEITSNGNIKIASNKLLVDKSDELHNEMLFIRIKDYDSVSNKLIIEKSNYDPLFMWNSPKEYEVGNELLASEIGIPLFGFDKLKFNEETGAYEAKEIKLAGATYKDISIQFDKNKLVSYSYKFVFDSVEHSFIANVKKIGGVEFDNPTACEVTKDTFNKYFGSYDSLKNMNLTINYKDSTSYGTYEGTIEIADSMVLDTFESEGDSGKVFYEILDYNPSDEKILCNNFDYNVSEETWSLTFDYNLHISTAKNYYYIPIFNIDDFTYSKEDNIYTADSIQIDDRLYENISIRFLNDLLCSYSYELTEDYVKSTISCYITDIDDTEVENPCPNVVTEETFNSYFGSYDSLKNMNLTINYKDSASHYGTYEGTIEIADGMAIDTYTNNLDSGKVYYNFIDYDSKEDILYFNKANFDGENWTDLIDDNSTIAKYKNNFYLPVFDISDFDYSNGYFVASSIKVGDLVYNNVKIKFKDQKLESYSYDLIENSISESSVTCSISNIDETEVENPCPTITTERAFNKFFHMTPEDLEKLNITLAYSYGIYSGIIQYDDGIRLDSYLRNDSTRMLEAYYINSIGDNVSYSYYIYESSWSTVNNETNSFDYFMANIMYLPIFSFDELTYNPETSAYEAELIKADSGDLTNVSIKFVDNRLVSYGFTRKLFGKLETFEVYVGNIGTTVILDPRANLDTK